MLEDVKATKEVHQNSLLSMANVVGVGVGLKCVGGVQTDEVSVIVNVSQKVPEAELNTEDKVPTILDGVKTDVVQIGNVQAFYDPTGKFRPAPGGVSIGHKDITAGTLGVGLSVSSSLYRAGDSYCSMHGMTICPAPAGVLQGVYILSNNHVLANSNNAQVGDPIYQPGPTDGGTPDDTIALLKEFVPLQYGGELNKVDCALAEPLNEGDVELLSILEIGDVSGTVEAELGMAVRKYGRTTQLTTGQVTQLYATIDVGGYPGGTVRFEDQIITNKMADPGDSGSILVEQSGQRVVGLLFAGSSSITIFNRIANVEEALGIKL